MQNKKTTVAGYLVLAASVLGLVATFLTGGDLGQAVGEVAGALAGIGLISASDGGH